MADAGSLWWPPFAQVSHELRTCSAEDQLQILQKYEKYLTAGVGHFRQPSAASKALIQGTAPLKLPDGGTFPPVSEVASAVLQLSADLVRRWWGPASGSCSPDRLLSPPHHLFTSFRCWMRCRPTSSWHVPPGTGSAIVGSAGSPSHSAPLSTPCTTASACSCCRSCRTSWRREVRPRWGPRRLHCAVACLHWSPGPRHSGSRVPAPELLTQPPRLPPLGRFGCRQLSWASQHCT